MATRLYLRHDVHAAVQGEDLVLLDILADAYLCIPGGAAHFELRGQDGAVNAVTSQAADALIGGGLATPDRPVGVRWPRPPDLPRSGPDFAGPWPGIGVLDAWRLMLCVLDLAIHYRGRSFADILAFARRARLRRTTAPPRVNLATCVRRFHAAAVWLPAPGKCLVRSFLLLRFLHRSGHDAQWVIGVRTWSFEAHCWLQSGDEVLDEAPERLLGYRPICAA
jgi:hypothetical protein